MKLTDNKIFIFIEEYKRGPLVWIIEDWLREDKINIQDYFDSIFNSDRWWEKWKYIYILYFF